VNSQGNMAKEEKKSPITIKKWRDMKCQTKIKIIILEKSNELQENSGK
jgi:hypothetical protein